jgi:hypothetical protein
MPGVEIRVPMMAKLGEVIAMNSSANERETIFLLSHHQRK